MSAKVEGDDLVGKRRIGLVVLLQLAKLALDYERARAPHPLKAMSAFLSGQKHNLKRIFRVGFRQHLAMSRFELQCARLGLGYQKRTTQLPWGIPEKFFRLSIEALPTHPLIDAGWLAELAKTEHDASSSAVPALSLLMANDRLVDRWAGVPRFNRGETSITSSARIAICLHLYYPDMWPKIRSALNAMPEPWDLYITVPCFACTKILAEIAREHPAVRFLTCANRGRDVLPFLRLLEMNVFDRYDAVCKLHTKRSPHIKDGDRWINLVLNDLLGNRDVIVNILSKIRSKEQVGMIGPQVLKIDTKHPAFRGGNARNLTKLTGRAALPKAALSSPFFAGTMFWFAPVALDGLRALALQKEEFPIEMGQTDGTLAHALERIIWPLVEQAGFNVDVVSNCSNAVAAPSFTAAR